MTSEVEALPGMTRRAPGPADNVHTMSELVKIPPMFNRRVVLLATASISDSNIFNNGLYQNCFILYRLAEAVGWLPIFVVNKKPTDLSGIPDFLRSCRLAEIDDILKQPIPVGLYLEIGMSISSNLRRFLKMLGARTAKLYLGNILNIDIETPMFFPGMHFSHHVVGEQDEIWTSPHYGQHAEYAAALNQVEPSGKSLRIAPYVWDPVILTNDGRRNPTWRDRRPDEKPCVIVMEPNISCQKTAVIPILMIEEYARANPNKDFDVVILNGDRLTASGYFKNSIEPSLSIVKSGKVTYAGRHDMITVMEKYPHATAICYHMNNEFNYMVLEFMWAGFPVLHNCRAWKDFGYFYPDHDTQIGAGLLKDAFEFHRERLEAYKGHARALAWRHSIYNPDVQSAWKALFDA